MNILIVDDQKAITEGLKNGVDWKTLGFEGVYTAVSAREARLILVNFDIHILLSDIEMPEEDGLSLFRWVRDRYPEIVGVFLTSHADFEYAREALKLGCYDYILQPARMEEVQRVIIGAVEQVKKNTRLQKLEHAGRLIADQRDHVLELLIMKAKEERWDECKGIFTKMRESSETDFAVCSYWSMVVQLLQTERNDRTRNEKNLIRPFRNALLEVFADAAPLVCGAQESEGEYLVMVGVEENRLNLGQWKSGVGEFYQFIRDQLGIAAAVYPETAEMKEFKPDRYSALNARKAANTTRTAGIFWEDVADEGSEDINLARVRAAEAYIKENISRGISRSEVAGYLHLNEEYFSRVFKKYTGFTYKDYEMKLRMDQAKKLLEYSRISISIIASKAGYDNFSHFSRAFKKETGLTPQEYRKEKTGR